jgi:hypothetical protein
MFLHFAMGLGLGAFVAQALETFLVASAKVTFRLPKAKRQGCYSYF